MYSRIVQLGLLPSILAVAALALASLASTAAGPGVATAEAANACKRYGDRPAYKQKRARVRRAIVCLLNRKRRQNGISRLRTDRRLQRAAQQHNDHMVRKGCFAHECAGEGSLEQRLQNLSYLGSDLIRWSYGENIAWGERGYSKPRAVVRAWMNSPGHRANILNPSFEEIGVGVTRGTPEAPKAKGATFTTDFGMAQRGRSAGTSTPVSAPGIGSGPGAPSAPALPAALPLG